MFSQNKNIPEVAPFWTAYTVYTVYTALEQNSLHIFPSVVIVADVDNNNFSEDAFVCGGLLGLC